MRSSLSSLLVPSPLTVLSTHSSNNLSSHFPLNLMTSYQHRTKESRFCVLNFMFLCSGHEDGILGWVQSKFTEVNLLIIPVNSICITHIYLYISHFVCTVLPLTICTQTFDIRFIRWKNEIYVNISSLKLPNFSLNTESFICFYPQMMAMPWFKGKRGNEARLLGSVIKCTS
jgi:hypothetical protein